MPRSMRIKCPAATAALGGEFGEGSGDWPKLAGGMGSLADDDPLKTVGSYWPHLSTTFDYERRSMPFGAAHTRTDDEVQANVACILYNNDLVEDDFELSKDNFLEVRSPNADGFFVDDRDSVELSPFVRERCMENCKEAWRSPTMRRF